MGDLSQHHCKMCGLTCSLNSAADVACLQVDVTFETTVVYVV